MTCIDRRTFLAYGSSAVITASLAGCGGGGSESAHPEVMSSASTPMAASDEGMQFRVVGRSHSLVIRPKGGTERSVGGVGRRQGKMNAPGGVAELGGLAYVVDTGNHRVQVFDGSGKAVRTFGEDTLLYPGGIATGRGAVYVADSRNGRIVAFTPDGQLNRILGAGTLSAPRGLQVLDDGIVVADPGLRKVLKLSFDGRVLQELGTGWVLPWDVATDGKHFYVADVSRNELGVTTLAGKLDEPLALDVAPANVWYRGGTLHVTSFV